MYKAKCKEKCFYQGVLRKVGVTYTFPDNHEPEPEFEKWFEVIERPRSNGGNPSTADQEKAALLERAKELKIDSPSKLEKYGVEKLRNAVKVAEEHEESNDSAENSESGSPEAEG